MKQTSSLHSFKNINDRRSYVEKSANVSLLQIASFSNNLSRAQNTNCENMIGATQIPIGVAGPLKITGERTNDSFFIPLATTEAALVASVSRGCKAISLSGGAYAICEKVGVSRGVVFKTEGIKESYSIASLLRTQQSKLASIASKTSSHITLLSINTSFFGKNLYVRFSFDTMDAMGMNMVTIATEAICNFIVDTFKLKLISIAGNFDIDKKPSWLNFILGRGKKVWAQTTISEEVLREVLKTTAEEIHEVNLSKNLYGSVASGSIGFNAHFANIIGALFLATGQDIAHTVEGSLGITTTEVHKSSLFISVFLPDLLAGTVGGGTGLPTQKEALSLLKIAGGDDGKNAEKFAEIIASSVLAGEISLLAALATGTLASAHKRFRGKE